MNIVPLRYRYLLFAALFLSIAACYSDATNHTEEKNEVTVRLRADPKGLNILLGTTGYALEVCSNIFSPLMVFDPNTLQLSPYLVKGKPSIQPIEEGKYKGGVSFTYEILEEARWDNGKPILATDYIFTFKTLMNPKVPAAVYRSYFSYLRDIKINPENPREFTVIADIPNAVAEFALSNVEVYPEYVYDPDGIMKDIPLSEFCQPEQAEQLDQRLPALEKFAELFTSTKFAFDKNHISGSGPYAIEEIIPDQRIVFKRKKNWWGDALSKEHPLLFTGPERLVYKIIPDETVAVSLLKNQEIDVMGAISAQQFVTLQTDEEATKNYNLYTPTSTLFSFIAINNQRPQLKDKRVRRAFAHLLKVEDLIQTSMSGLGQRMVGPVHPKEKYYHKELPLIQFDLDAARQLLADAGWKDQDNNGILDKMIDGEQVEMKLRYRNSQASVTGKNTGLLLKENARKVGIEIELINQGFNTVMKAYRQRDYELLFSARQRDPMPDDFMQSWHTNSDTPSGGNRIGFGNATSDALIEEIRATLDEEKRNKLYLKFQELVYEEQPCVFLFAAQERIAIHKRFQADPSMIRPGYFPKYFKTAKD